jgi:hypothetical protein
LGSVDDVLAVNPRLATDVLDFTVEAPHDQYRPGRAQQAHLGDWQAHAAGQRYPEVLRPTWQAVFEEH